MTRINKEELIQHRSFTNGEEITENALLLLMEVANIGTTGKSKVTDAWLKVSNQTIGYNSTKPMPDHPNLHKVMN